MATRTFRAPVAVMGWLAVAAALVWLVAPTTADVRMTRINPATGHTYHVISKADTNGMSWTDAEAEAVGLGGHLVTVNDAAENDWVWSRFHSYRNHLWNGLNDEVVEGTWEWVSGEPFTYDNWAPGQPQPWADANYTFMDSGLWYIAASGHTHPYGVVEVDTGLTRYDWKDPIGGVFSIPGNWDPAGPPGAGDGAYFNHNATYTVTFLMGQTNLLASVEQGDVSFALGGQSYNVTEAFVGGAGGAVLRLANGALNSDYATVADTAGTNGAVYVGASTLWTNTERISVGNHGVGELNIAGGGQVVTGTARIGDGEDGEGTVVVSGGTSSLTGTRVLYVGYEGIGGLDVQPGGAVAADGIYAGDQRTGQGTITVTGPGATLGCTGSNWLVVGYRGAGELTAGGGAALDTQTSGASLGWDAGSAGSASLTDGGTTWQTGELDVGRNGQGQLEVLNGATITTSNVMWIGREWLGQGLAVVRGAGSAITVNNWLTLGNIGRGKLEIGDGGVVDVVGNDISIGTNKEGCGQAEVSSGSSRLTTTGNLWVGNSGAGLLEVSDGAQVSAAALTVGNQTTALGGVCVRDGGSELTLSNACLVGNSGVGTVAVKDGGKLDIAQNCTLGQWVGSRGELSSEGAGSQVEMDWGLTLGNQGQGSVYVRDGGEMAVGQTIWLGGGTGGEGALNVSGAGSTVETVSGEIRVGDVGTGTVTADDGGQMTIHGWVVLGLNAGSVGTVELDGAGTRLENHGSGITIGYAGSGTLDARHGADVDIDSEIVLADQLGSYADVIIHGAGSTFVSRMSGIRVARRGTAFLSVSGGASLSTGSASIGNEDALADGTVSVTGAGSTWEITAGELSVGENGTGRLYVFDGAVVSVTGGARIGFQATSDGTAVVGGAGSVLSTDQWMWLGDMGAGSLTVLDGGLVSAVQDINVRNSSITLGGGTIQAPVLRFHNHDSPLMGYGTVAARLENHALSVRASGGTLTLGDGSLTYGFGLAVGDAFYVDPDAALEVLDADAAQFWGPVMMNNGVVVGRNGLEFCTADPTGYGVIVGAHNRQIAAPAGRVDMTQTLDVGDSIARVYSDGIADLGTRTTLADGWLIATDGVRFGLDDVLAGYGGVGGDVELAGGIIATEPGETITVTGRLYGCGVTVGDVDAFIDELASPTGTVALGDGIDVGAQAATVHSVGPASLGTETTLAGGSIIADNGLLLRTGNVISGHGTIDANVELSDGALRGSGGTLTVDGVVSGYGLLINDVAPATLEAPSGTVCFDGDVDFGSDDVTVHSAGPAAVGAAVALGGGSITAENGLAIDPAGRLTGYGTVDADVLNAGTIEPNDGTLWFAGAVTPGSGSIAGAGTFGLAAGGSFVASGSIDADVETAAGSNLDLTGDLAVGRDGGAGAILGGTATVGAHTLALRGGRAALPGQADLAGGEIVAAAGLDIAPGGLITGRGTLTAGTTPADGIDNEGTLAVAGNTDVRGDFRNLPGGQVIASGGSTLAFWDDAVHDGDFMKAAAGSFIAFFGSYGGGGPFTGTGTVQFEGDLHPGSSPAVVDFGGNVTLTATARLVSELADDDNSDPLNPAYDALAAVGEVSLDGTLELAWLPRAGDPSSKFGGVYNLITSETGIAGMFADVECPFEAYIESIAYDVDVNGDGSLFAVQLTLHDLIDGDVDFSGAVDYADYAALRDAYGTSAGATWALGDTDLDGDIDWHDYVALKGHFGDALPPAGPSVPEPASLSLVALGAALAVLRRRTKARAIAR